MKSFLSKFVIIQFLLCSGSRFYYLAFSSITIPLFLVTSMLLWYMNRGRFNTIGHNQKIAFAIIFWTLLVNILFHDDITTNLYLTLIFYCLSTCFAVSVLDFYWFREKLLKYLNFLCLISIIVQIMSILGLPSKVVSINGFTWSMTLGIFNCDWGGNITNRMASIYWEPGVFQIVLIYVLCLFSDQYSRISYIKTNMTKFILPIICLLWTQSTTGYFAFAILVLGISMSIAKAKKDKIKYILIVLFGFMIIYYIVNSNAVQGKFDRGSESYSSYTIRYADNIALLRMSSEKPITGYGMDSKSYLKRSFQLDNMSASNGWLYNTATNGIVSTLLFIVFIWNGLKRFKGCIHPVFIFLSLFVSQCNEYIMFFPTTFMFIYKFRRL